MMIQGLLLFATAGISVFETELVTYPFSDPDPVPAVTERRYPYFRYDGSTAVPTRRRWTQVALENARTRVVVMPEVGGKVWSATDKVTGRDFLYCNHVMKFRDIAMRGPWLSGGIEFNFGIIGHAPSSATPVDWFVRTNADASVSCFVASAEYITRAWWQVEVRLRPSAENFETRVTWYNASGLPQPYYNWMNAAYPVGADTELLFPGTRIVGHEGEIESLCWPMDADGNRIGHYRGNAFGGAKSYHVLPGNNGFYAAWWPDIGFGSYHRAESYEKYGRKIFYWALSREGGIWEDLLTDSDGQYGELQSGRAFIQPRWGNYRTPFKHPTFAPGSTERFTETWGPVRDLKEVAADLAAPLPKDRPIEAPADFDWRSAYGHYVRGVQHVRERNDREGRAEILKAVADDRFLVPAWSALAECEFRRGDTAATHAAAEKALAIDMFEPLANYLDGFAYFVEGDTTSARERLGVSSFQPQYRSAALALVARTYLKDGDPAKAVEAARKALAANDANLDALLALAIARRGEADVAGFLRARLEAYPLFHAFRYELARTGGPADYGRYVANELPDETWMELGSWYAETGLEKDARTLFARAHSPLACIRLGNLAAAKAMPVAGVFPFRREDLPALARAVKDDGHWKFRYLRAVLLASFGFDAEADGLLGGCGDEPDEAVFYAFRAMRRTGADKIADLRRAAEIGDDWRLGRALAAAYEAEGDFAAMLSTTTAYLAKFTRKNPLEIAHARALLKLKRYRECMAYLEGVKLLPSEHRDNATGIWHAAQDALGLKRTWPENLGQGEPFPDRKKGD